MKTRIVEGQLEQMIDGITRTTRVLEFQKALELAAPLSVRVFGRHGKLGYALGGAHYIDSSILEGQKPGTSCCVRFN